MGRRTISSFKRFQHFCFPEASVFLWEGNNIARFAKQHFASVKPNVASGKQRFEIVAR